MTSVDAEQLRIALGEVANTLHALTLIVEHQETATRNAAQDSVVITRNLKRIADALRKLQLSQQSGLDHGFVKVVDKVGGPTTARNIGSAPND